MKKNMLSLKGVQVLNKAAQKDVIGGKRASFSCYCGFVDSVGVDQSSFSVSSDSITGALGQAGSLCGGWGATCSGVS